jgi:hypothetical protein
MPKPDCDLKFVGWIGVVYLKLFFVCLKCEVCSQRFCFGHMRISDASKPKPSSNLFSIFLAELLRMREKLSSAG